MGGPVRWGHVTWEEKVARGPEVVVSTFPVGPLKVRIPLAVSRARLPRVGALKFTRLPEVSTVN